MRRFVFTYKDGIGAKDEKEAKEMFVQVIKDLINEEGINGFVNGFVDMKEVTLDEFRNFKVSGK